MAGTLEQKCPSCGAMMRYDPKKSLLICDYCETELAVSESGEIFGDAEEGGFDFHAFQQQAESGDAESLPIYHCVSCGAELIAPPEEFALTCPYCRNNIVLTDKISGRLRPDGVVPFRIEARELPERLKAFYRDKKLLPKRFFSEAAMENITGVYVPFWIFSGNVSGSLEYSGWRESRRTEGNYTITDRKYYDIVRGVSADFDGLPVDAGGRMDDDMMDSLEPFDLSEQKPFQVGWLAGFTADRFDVPAADLEERARLRMENTVSGQVSSDVSRQYGGVSLKGARLMRKLTAKYVLLPVYFFSLYYEGQEYRFAVNGQTGKTVGHVPTGKAESRACFLLRFGIAAGGILLLLLLKYLLGR